MASTATATTSTSTASSSSSGDSSNRNARPQWREAVAGASAGAISRTILAPVERIKLLKQLEGSLAASSTATRRSKSAWTIVYEVYKEQGVLSFWRGNLPSVLRVSGTAAVNFTCMDSYKKLVSRQFERQRQQQQSSNISGGITTSTALEKMKRRHKLYTSLIAGGMAGATSTTVMYPLEFARTRLALDMGKEPATRQYTGMLDVIRTIVRLDGVTGLFQGYGIALCGGIFYRIILLGGYDATKTELLYRKQQQQQQEQALSNATASSDVTSLSWIERIVTAQGISLTAGTLSYPFDSVRRRMMMQAGKPYAERLYRDSIHCCRMVWQKEGLSGFYLGFGPNVVRSISGALLLFLYDTIKPYLYRSK